MIREEERLMHTHTFAICAYGNSPYLETCMKSLREQSRGGSRVILCTSTPSDYISGLAEKYEIPVFVREGESGIAADWNFAYETADSRLVTIAHQDDAYHRDYAAAVQDVWSRYPDTSLFMTDAAIVKHGKVQRPGAFSMIKKALRLPLRNPRLNHLEQIKKLPLRFGNPVICPSCTYDKERLETPLFRSPMQFALDWDTAWRLAGLPGRFICVERPLMFYRVHDGATTKACIEDQRRAREEAQMFRKMWPGPIAGLLMRFYRRAYEEYDG